MPSRQSRKTVATGQLVSAYRASPSRVIGRWYRSSVSEDCTGVIESVGRTAPLAPANGRTAEKLRKTSPAGFVR